MVKENEGGLECQWLMQDGRFQCSQGVKHKFLILKISTTVVGGSPGTCIVSSPYVLAHTLYMYIFRSSLTVGVCTGSFGLII